MNWKRMKVIAAVPVALAVTAGAVQLGTSYRNGNGFHPFGTDREMKNNQILFPDSQESTGKQTNQAGEDDSSFLEKDNNKEDKAQQGNSSDYLFDGEDSSNPENRPTGALAQGDGAAAGTADSAAGGPIGAGGVYEVTDDTNGADVILPGGNTGNGGVTIPGGQGGSGSNSGGSGSGSGNGSGSGANAGGNGGGTAGGTTGGGTAPSPAPSNGQEPTPGYGSASKDMPMTDPIQPSWTISSKNLFTDTTKDKLTAGKYEVVFQQPASANMAYADALYKGQKNVTKEMIFHSLEAYVDDYTAGQYYMWASGDLGEDRYVQITGISFDTRGETITDFPVDIPEDEGSVTIYISYRLSLDDAWTEAETDYGWFSFPGISYSLMTGRTVVLGKPLKSKGEVIAPEDILNRGRQYPESTETLNLMAYQQDFFGKNTRVLSGLFPGWKEDGTPVPFMYTVTPGRHVLEPAGLVPLNEDYQVELEQYWMRPDYSVLGATEVSSGASIADAQTLTAYKGRTTTDENGDEWVERLTVPQYVQAVDFKYFPGLAVDYLELPETAVYVNTAGMPTYQDDILLYERGLKVNKGYIVSDDNPRYTSENGLLYNLDKTELLGVPTDITELTVDAGITNVLLPYQTKLKALILDITDTAALPEINYERLRRGSVIVVPDALMDDYLTVENAMLQRTGLSVMSMTMYEQGAQGGYALKDCFLLTPENALHQILRESVHWLRLPDYITGVEAVALSEQKNSLSVLLLPENGSMPEFETGCFDGYEKITLACYSAEQRAAAEKLAAAYPEGIVRVRSVESYQDYSYLETDSGYLLLAVPAGIVTFDGTFPTKEGTKAAAVIGDRVFAGSTALKRVILPKETKAVGYQAFQSCSNLESVLLDSRDTFLIGKDAFDNCGSLRFVATNALNVTLEDPEFELSTEYEDSVPQGHLWCLADTEGCNGNWTSFTEDDDVAEFKLLPCGGTYVLYGVDSEGTPWIALRAETAMSTDTIELPETTQYIHHYAFESVHAASGEYFTVNWDALDLGEISYYAFAYSDLGERITLPENVRYAAYVFQGCKKLKEVTLPGTSPAEGIDLSRGVFAGCSALEKATFGYFNRTGSMYYDTFNQCSNLKDIVFTCKQPPNLTLFRSYGSTYPFLFNSYDWNTAEMECRYLKITVPEGSETDYVNAWRYPMAGYTGTDSQSAYQEMWNAIYNQIANDRFNNGDFSEITDEEVRTELDRQLLASENRVRRLLGMEIVDEVSYTYRYIVNENGFITLTGAKDVEATRLTEKELELPEGNRWTLRYIAADAFAESPNLRWVEIPDTLVGIYANAFRGVQFDETDSEDGLLLYLEGDAFGLLVSEPGVPFNFGVPDSRIQVISMPLLSGKDTLDWYLTLWAAPMAGYNFVSELEDAVRTELGTDATDAAVRAEMEKRLLPAENRVRALLGLEETKTLTYQFTLSAKQQPASGTDIEDPDGFDTEQSDAQIPETPETPAPAEDAEEANGDAGADEAEDTDKSDEAADEAAEATEEEQETGEPTGTEEETAE